MSRLPKGMLKLHVSSLSLLLLAVAILSSVGTLGTGKLLSAKAPAPDSEQLASDSRLLHLELLPSSDLLQGDRLQSSIKTVSLESENPLSEQPLLRLRLPDGQVRLAKLNLGKN